MRRPAGDRLDVVVELRLSRLRSLRITLCDPVAVGDDVREGAEERHEEDEDQPHDLLAPAHVVPAEDVDDDLEQEKEPQDPQEEDDDCPERIPERVIGYRQHRASLENSQVAPASRIRGRTDITRSG